ncbi:MAG: hypothetical protein IJ562_04295 [Prevotella sp.]|nr:hypothetical protein [Prevotella sp.]
MNNYDQRAVLLITLSSNHFGIWEYVSIFASENKYLRGSMRKSYYLIVLFLLSFFSCNNSKTEEGQSLSNLDDSEGIEFMMSNYMDNLPRVMTRQESRRVSLFYHVWNHTDHDFSLYTEKHDEMDAVFFQLSRNDKHVSIPTYLFDKKTVRPHTSVLLKIVLTQDYLAQLGFSNQDSLKKIIDNITVSYVDKDKQSNDKTRKYMTRKEIVRGIE